jgi:large subunit ribosomal protein L19
VDSRIIKEIEKEYYKRDLPQFRVGDTVDVHVRVKEGDRERIQIFTGTVISRRGTGTGEMFTVRRIVAGEGVERIFPIHSPAISDVRVRRHGSVRRAKLYYLRERVGKATKVKERVVEGAKKEKRSRKRRELEAELEATAVPEQVETPSPQAK